MKITIKKCSVEDVPVLYEMTRELMEFHDMLDIFTMTEERLCELVESGAIQSYIAEADSQPAGIINFFYKYTTFTGQKILYLEDLYVRSQFRKYGIGSIFMNKLKEIAFENDCNSIEWKCADFNESGKRFYAKIGAKPENIWQTYTIERNSFTINERS